MISPGLFRLFLAGVVVLHHSTPLRLGGWAVLVFFVLSGYWISRMWDDKYSRTKSPGFTFIVSRWWRLFPVMAACILLYFLWAGSMQGYSWEWVLRQFPIIGSTWRGTPLPPQWSLDVEMQFYLAFSLVAVVFSRSLTKLFANSAVWFVAGGACVSLAVVHLLGGGSTQAPYLAPWSGLFLLGVAIHKSRWMPSAPLSFALAALFLLGTVALIVYPETRSAYWIAGSEAAYKRVAGLNALPYWPELWLLVGVLLFLPYVARDTQGRSPFWDRSAGNMAYAVYMFHWIPREWYYAHVDWNRPLLFNVALLGANIFAAFAGGWLIYAVIDKPFDRWRAKWVAGRMIQLREPS